MQISTDKEIIEILKANKLKVTPQRIGISKIVLTSKDHPSAEDIYDKIKSEYPTMSLATVYKTLILLERIGLVSELRFDSNHTRYDSNMFLHINIVCPSCMDIQDFESEYLNKTWKNTIKEIDGDIVGQRIDVYRVCDICK